MAYQPLEHREPQRPPEAPRAPTPLLDSLGRDLTSAAAAGELDLIVGREREVDQVMAVLVKTRKNNVVLIGDPGVGKTAIAELLAQRIVARAVPEALQEMRVVSLEVGALAAGAGVRGAFEDRLQQLVAEAEASAGHLILFIDEIHTLLGAGNAQGGLDGANLLKPALARGSLRCIGASTTAEYRELFEKDGALSRRFQPVQVEEPSQEETERILQGILEELEEAHGVHIPRELASSAVALADRFVRERRRPDKVIDLLDESCSDLRLSPHPPDAFGVQELTLLRQQIQLAERARNAKEALRLRRILSLYRQLPQSPEPPELSRGDLLRTLNRWKGVAPCEAGWEESALLSRLEARLLRRILGQDEAISAIARRLVRSRLAPASGRPLATFLLIGPTGVGKTETAHAIAEELFSDRRALVRIDMSEHREPHSVARLIGSPPGYVGYRDAGALATQLLARPASVVLFDEVEKGHAAVHDLLLQILEDGRLTDSAGRVLDFTQAVIVLTSNLAGGRGRSETGFRPPSGQGDERVAASPQRQERDGGLRRQLVGDLRPELLNRIDEILELVPLPHEALVELSRCAVRRVVAPFRALPGWSVRVAPGVAEALVDEATARESGARLLRRQAERTVGDFLAQMVAEHGTLPQQVVVTPEVVNKAQERGVESHEGEEQTDSQNE